MRFGGLDVRLRRAAPHRDQATGSGSLFEFTNVVAQLLGKIHFRLALFDVRAVDFLDVVVIKNRRARRDGRQQRLQLIEQALIEYAGIRRGLVHVVFEDVPTGEDEVVKPGERDEFLYFWRAAIGALAKADGAHLAERSNGLGQALANGLDAGDESGSHRAHAGDHHAEFALGGGDRAVVRLRLGAFYATRSGRELHFAAGALGMGEGGFTMLMLSCCRSIGKLLTMAPTVSIPPIGHEHSRFFQIHACLCWWRWIVTVTATYEVVIVS